MVKDIRVELGDPRAIVGSRGVPYPHEVEETYPETLADAAAELLKQTLLRKGA